MDGILQYVDKNSNILITNATERVFPDFILTESLEELSCSLPYDPQVAFSQQIVERAGLYQDDEILLDHSGKILIRGDAIAMILSVDQSSSAWRSNAFPRFFAYATARTKERDRLLRVSGLSHHRAFIDHPPPPDARQPDTASSEEPPFAQRGL